MTIDEEPALRRRLDAGPSEGDGEPLREGIERLVTTQPYGVLCTQAEGQPYGSLIAFAFSGDLSRVVFSTPVATRKYRLLKECEQVALVVDNRPDHVDNMMRVEAITATGRAREVEPGPHNESCAEMLLARHPYLRSFVEAESCALFEIEVTRFLHVTRFQEVNQWVPTKR
jgi:nitroimidazol reductase NimA-like FMN-containing flavoprotein (pyridoxamine 5'-phosphate oxidase superfamily)